MKTIYGQIPDTLCAAARTCLPAGNPVLFDIETTGLSPDSSHLYLIGAVSCRNNSWELRQWFMEKPSEEQALLQTFADFLAAAAPAAAIHYNGDAFDIPYLRRKYAFYRLPDPLADVRSVDLYRQLRPYRNILHLDSMKQKDIERYAGIKREDRMSGAELIRVWKDYLRTASPEDFRLLLLHNRDDLLGLAGILPAGAICRLFQGEFLASLRGFQNAESQETDTEAVFDLVPAVPVAVPVHASSAYCRLDTMTGSGNCTLTVPALSGTLRHFFPDYKNYYYLPAEDQAIHRSVARYVDRAHRVRASASTCYQKVSGVFLPQLSSVITPAFRREYRDKVSWFPAEEDSFRDMDQIHGYVMELMGTLTG